MVRNVIKSYNWNGCSGRTSSKEKRINEETTNNKQQTTNNKQQTTNNKQQTTNNNKQKNLTRTQALSVAIEAEDASVHIENDSHNITALQCLSIPLGITPGVAIRATVISIVETDG
jgi:hypothetical protein